MTKNQILMLVAIMVSLCAVAVHFYIVNIARKVIR